MELYNFLIEAAVWFQNNIPLIGDSIARFLAVIASLVVPTAPPW